MGLDRVRADQAGQLLTLMQGPATSTATGIARRFTQQHWRGAEAGPAAARRLGRLGAECLWDMRDRLISAARVRCCKAGYQPGADSYACRTFRQILAEAALTRPRLVRGDMASAGRDQLDGHRGALGCGLLPRVASRPGRWVSGAALAGSAAVPGGCDPGAGGLPAEPKTTVRKPMRGLTGSSRRCLGQLCRLGDQRVSPSFLSRRGQWCPARWASDGCTAVRCRRGGASWPSLRCGR